MVAVAGKPERSGTISEPVTAIVVEAVLLLVFGSLVADVVPATVWVPTVVGVPDTVQAIVPPGATDVGGTGTHTWLRPAGKPVTAHVAAVAAIAGAAALEHENVPL